MKRYTSVYLFVLLSASFFVFRKWFILPEVIGGDWPYYYEDNLKNFFLVPMIWQPWLGNGLGDIQPLLGLHLFGSIVIVLFAQWINIPWNIVYKVGWFGLFFILSFFSPIVLWYRVFASVSLRWPSLLSGLIYSTNTYILMVTGGGQMGVALAYSVAPLVLASFIKLLPFLSSSKQNIKHQILNIKYLAIAGSSLGFQVMIDPRIGYGTMVGVGIYIVTSLLRYFVSKKGNFFQTLFLTFLGLSYSVIVAALLNAFWLVPMIVMRNNPLENLGSAYTSVESLKFFSFADFSHALALLHPNWPENIFGKTYFLQPEFLILPILAFASLLFLGRTKGSKVRPSSTIYFFSILGLIGVFLAKGAQEPFGSVYQWMFTYVPGFVMFRDPTKWYVLTAISYSILIPFTLKQLAELRIRGKTLLITLFILFWLFTIREGVLGKLGGTFAAHTVPREYKELESFLQAQPNFARTLWVPRQSRFTYASLDHIATEAEPLFSATNPGQLKEKLELLTSQELLKDIGVGYVMIPYDSLGELFLKDRTYDNSLRKEYEAVLDGIPWLTKINSANIPIYRTSKHKDLFSLSTGGVVTYRRLRLDQYDVSFMISAPSQLHFSQAYHPGWVLVGNGGRVAAQKSDTGLSLFTITSPGTYQGKIIFDPQKYVYWGLVVSAVTLLGIICKIVLL